MVCALSDTDLIRKLLAMKIKATSAEMLAVCHTHICQLQITCLQWAYLPKLLVQYRGQQRNQQYTAPHVVTAQNATLQGESAAQQKTPPTILARRSVTGSRSAGSLTRPRMPTSNPSHNLNVNMEEGKWQLR